MGAWGTALYSDDLAANLRDEFRDLIGSGLSEDEALTKLEADYAASLGDQEEAPVFWLAIAHVAWKLGRPIPRATSEALRIISTGADLQRWTEEPNRRKRATVLERLQTELQSEPPAPKRPTRPSVAANDWHAGEVIAFRLLSGAWTLFRVIGHHEDRGGRCSICEPLDWSGSALPAPGEIALLPIRPAVAPWQFSQFILGEPRRAKDANRFSRTGVTVDPAQVPGRCAVVVFPHVDKQLRDIFGLQ